MGRTINVKDWNKITEEEKTQYPQFIAYIDFNSKGTREFNQQLFIKAMEETNILEAMKRMETVIKNQGENIYLVDIYEKTTEETPEGYPLYKSSIMTRVSSEYPNSVSSISWHFRSVEHAESDVGYNVFWESDDKKGTLEWFKNSFKNSIEN